MRTKTKRRAFMRAWRKMVRRAQVAERIMAEDRYDVLHQVVTAVTAAAMVGVTRATIASACRKGWLPAVQDGATWLMIRADVLRFWGHRSLNFHATARLQGIYATKPEARE